MWNKLNTFLNCVMGAFAGVFLAESIYTYWDYKTHPEIYETTSAPWYTAVLLYGVITLAVILAALIIKLVIRKRVGQRKRF